jgi:hypothetical protein
MLAKLLLLSIVIGTIAVPVLTARDANGARALKKMILLMIIFNISYFLAVRYVYPHLL